MKIMNTMKRFEMEIEVRTKHGLAEAEAVVAANRDKEIRCILEFLKDDKESNLGHGKDTDLDSRNMLYLNRNFFCLPHT